MKKIYYILTLVVAAMTISACNNFIDENATPNVDGQSNKITFTASAEVENRSTLDLTDGTTARWNGTENLGLFYYYTPEGGSEVKFVKNFVYTTNATASESATFTGEAEWWDGDGDAAVAAAATHKVYIYYPYGADNDSKTSSNAVGTLPAEQEYDATASQWDMSKYDYLYSSDNPATWGETLDFGTLKRLFAVLRLGITNNTGEDVVIKKVTVTSQGEKILAGDFTFNLSKGRAENALTNRTDAPVKATHGSSTAYGYWTAPESSISTTVANGAVKAGEVIDVRVMMNAGYAPSDDSSKYFFDNTTAYLAGDTFTVNIVTDKGAHPEITFTAGALLRGQRAGKSIVLDAVPAGEPNATSVVSNDSSENKFYMNNTITISGTNLLNAQNVKVGGVAAEVVSQSNTELVVKVPDCTGAATTAADYDITYTYEDEEATLGTISIYPFYHYENITLGVGASSKSEYAEFTASNAFFYPDLGEVVSTNKWYDDEMDKFTLGYAEYPSPIKYTKVDNTTYISFDKTYITEQQYYDVLPYVFFITNSAGKVTLVGPANTASQLKTHLRNDGSGNVNLPSEAGTPLMWYRSMRSSNSKENACREAVLNGTLAEMSYTGSVASAGAPSMAKEGLDLSSQSSLWREGTVLLVQYVSYEAAYNSDSAHGAKPAANSDVAKIGFVHIKNLENVFYATDENGNTTVDGNNQLIVANPTTGKRDMKITFDMYWSKKLN